MSVNKETVAEMKNIITGIATAGAAVSGWSAGEASLLGMKAEEAASGRIALGQSIEAVLDASFDDAEMILVMDVFCKALAQSGDTQAAFDRVVAIKMAASEGAPGAATACEVANQAYADALKGGLAPQAAMLSAFVSAGSVMRLAASGAH